MELELHWLRACALTRSSSELGCELGFVASHRLTMPIAE